jgi:hypothetical protein
MNANDPFERMIAGYMASEGSASVSDRRLDDALASTSRMRPYPRWLALMKEPPMRISSPVVVGSPTLRLAVILALTLALGLLGAAAVAAAASLLPSPSTLAPFGPAANGSLVYSLAGDIYLADADGGNPRAILAGDTVDRYPWFSHDGRTIAFVRGPDQFQALMVMNADGSNVRQLLGGGNWNAEFMPSDTQMVATRDRDVFQRDLSIIDVATGAVRDLDLGGLSALYWQMPRPRDGREIIFPALTARGSSDVGLYAIAPDGTGLRTIGAIATGESNDQQSFQASALSPDGTTIAYWNWERKEGTASPDDYLHIRDLTTGAEVPVAYSSPNGGWGKAATLSPDGSMVVFESSLYQGAKRQLYYGPVDGSAPSGPMGPSFSDQDLMGFSLSPDGTQLLLGLTDTVSVIDLATGATRVLPGMPTMPSWQRVAAS